MHHNTPEPGPIGNQLSPDLGALTTLRLHDRGRALVIEETIPARARVWRIDVDSGSVVPTRPARTKSYHTIIEPTPPQHSTGPSLEKIIQKCAISLREKEKRESVPLRYSNHPTNLDLSADQLGVSLGAEALGALDGGTQTTVDDQLGQDTQGTRHTEQDGVVVGLGQTVVLQEHTRVLEEGG